MKKENIHNIIKYISSFALPGILLLICYKLCKIYPFGDISLLDWDAKLQHKDYYSYLWDVLHKNASLNHSMSKSLGGRFIGIFAFYVSSFSNLFLYFFDKSEIPQFLSYSYLIKTSLCGLFSYIYLKKRFEINYKWGMILSISYSFIEYNAIYCRNLMWIDAVFMLPLVCLGVWCSISNNNKWLLSVSVAISIINNWYTGYMICLFAGIYLLYELFCYNKSNKIRIFFITIGYIIIGASLSAVVLIPACLSLVGGKASFQFIFKEMNMTFLNVFTGFDIYANYNHQDAPMIYSGSLVLFLALSSLVDKRIEGKNRIGNIILILLLLLSFIFRQLDVVWTFFHRSTSYFFRFSFILSFIMVIIAGGYISRVNYKIDKTVSITTLLIIFGFISFFEWEDRLNNPVISYLVFGLLSVSVLFIMNNRKTLFFLSFILLCIELVINEYQSLSRMQIKTSYYSQYYSSMNDLVSEYGRDDLYRFEKNYSFISSLNSKVATGESLQFGYKSIENYSSAYDSKVDQFLANMGYSDYPQKEVFPCETYWNDSLPLMDSMLGIRYVISDKKPYGYREIEKKENSLFLNDDWNVYENIRVLPLIYGVTPNNDSLNYTEDPFENQNRFVSQLVGWNAEVYYKIDVEKIDSELELYKAKLPSDTPLYLFVDGSDIHKNLYYENCELYINGERYQNCCERFLINGIYLGEFDSSDEIEIEIKNNSASEYGHEVYLYGINENEFNKVYNHIKCHSNGVNNFKIDYDGDISFAYDSQEESTVMLSVPYEDNWKCFIDEKQIKIDSIGDIFIVVKVPEGKHSIKLVYYTPGFNVGIFISVVSLLILFVINNSALLKKIINRKG